MSLIKTLMQIWIVLLIVQDILQFFFPLSESFIAVIYTIQSTTMDVWDISTNERKHSIEIPEWNNLNSRFVPSSQNIILWIDRKLRVYSNSTLELINDFEISLLDLTSTIELPFISNEDTDTLFVHQFGQMGVTVWNIKTGANKMKFFPNLFDEHFFIYQGMYGCYF